ncbi:hypothetical protein WJX84_011754 [Apatococcus fuscideae]|uniref:AP2/ERF domain-containing protein n=1 Tax=Apatococcus fuscideae TaxID=2026836 RepID=A0AAW1SUH0_9CHLO
MLLSSLSSLREHGRTVTSFRASCSQQPFARHTLCSTSLPPTRRLQSPLARAILCEAPVTDRKLSGTSSQIQAACRFRSVVPAPGGAAYAKIYIAPKTIHLGTFEDPATAARAYDWVCINQGRDGSLNFPPSHYAAELWAELRDMSLSECLVKIKGFARQQPIKKSRYKGVYETPEGRFRAAIWHKGAHVELGWYTDDVSAAQACDKAAICLKRPETTLNFAHALEDREVAVLQARTLDDLSEEMVSSAREDIRPKTSSFCGVCWAPVSGKFKAQLTVNTAPRQKFVSLGYWTSDVEAAKAWDQAAICSGKDVLKLNYPVSNYNAEVLQATPLEAIVAQMRSQAH